MRLTINLEPDLYAVAVSLAKAEDCSISAAVNRLLRRSLPGSAAPGAGDLPTVWSGATVSSSATEGKWLRLRRSSG